MNPLIVTKSRYVLGHGRLSASGILTGHSEGTWAIFIIKVKLMTSIPDCWKRRDCPTDCKPPAGRVPCPGSLWQWQWWRAQVSSYCSTVSSHCILPSRSWVGENVPKKRVALAARDRYHAGEEKGRGLPAKLGPGEKLFSQSCSPQGEAHTFFLHSSCEGGSFWGGHPQNPANITSRGVKLPRVLPRVSFPFLASEAQKPKWLIWTNTSAKGFQFCLSFLMGTVYCRLRGQRDSKRGEKTRSAH